MGTPGETNVLVLQNKKEIHLFNYFVYDTQTRCDLSDECMSNSLRIPKTRTACSELLFNLFFLSCPMSFLPLLWRAFCIVSSSLAVKSLPICRISHPSLME